MFPCVVQKDKETVTMGISHICRRLLLGHVRGNVFLQLCQRISVSQQSSKVWEVTQKRAVTPLWVRGHILPGVSFDANQQTQQLNSPSWPLLLLCWVFVAVFEVKPDQNTVCRSYKMSWADCVGVTVGFYFGGAMVVSRRIRRQIRLLSWIHRIWLWITSRARIELFLTLSCWELQFKRQDEKAALLLKKREWPLGSGFNIEP